jgi:hypothetical protein
MKTAFILLLLLLAFGIVGRIDYDCARIAEAQRSEQYATLAKIAAADPDDAAAMRLAAASHDRPQP